MDRAGFEPASISLSNFFGFVCLLILIPVMLLLFSSNKLLVILFLAVTRTIGMASSKGRIVNHGNSGTVGVGELVISLMVTVCVLLQFVVSNSSGC